MTMWTRLTRLTGDAKGQSLLEAALVLPLLITIVLGVFEFARVIQANNILANITREGANMASRTSSTDQQIMDAVASTTTPLNMNTYGQMYITQVTWNSSGTAIVTGQTRWTHSGTYNPASKVGPTVPSGGNPSPAAVGLPVDTNLSGQSGNVVEAYYNYPVIFGNALKISPKLYSVSVF